jgi:uncharacterized peroxidase-related enzyme
VEDPDYPQALVSDWRAATAGDERLAAILAYAERLTLAPASLAEADIDRMRDAGLDDEAVLHVCEVASYFNYVNRMADGLAVQLEEEWSWPIIHMPERGAPGDME